MDINNVISPTQARLNFCDKDYVLVLKDVNEAITKESRTVCKVEISWKGMNAYAFNKAAQALREHGFSVTNWVDQEAVCYMTVCW